MKEATMPQAPKVFISYVHNNKRAVRRLVADLKAAGVDVWWDDDGLKARRQVEAGR